MLCSSVNAFQTAIFNVPGEYLHRKTSSLPWQFLIFNFQGARTVPVFMMVGHCCTCSFYCLIGGSSYFESVVWLVGIMFCTCCLIGHNVFLPTLWSMVIIFGICCIIDELIMQNMHINYLSGVFVDLSCLWWVFIILIHYIA